MSPVRLADGLAPVGGPEARTGLFFSRVFMPPEPPIRRTISFIDGQNLHKSTKEAFGYSYPNYDVLALSRYICSMNGWTLIGTRFYSGVPDKARDFFWHSFWSNKLLTMSRQGVYTFTRPLRYHEKYVENNGQFSKAFVPEEKGIDVRIAIDVIRMAHRQLYDIALVFSQDQDLSEVADEIKTISMEQGRWIKIASSFPAGCRNQRGINGTDWIPFDRLSYDSCLDPNDYRPKSSRQHPLKLK